MATYLEQALEKIKEFEGSVPWMYLDTVGKVTVGVGLMLVSDAAAHALPFMASGRAASLQDISREFSRVTGMKKGQLAKFYFNKTALLLSPETIDAKLRDTLLGFEGYLRTHLRGYDAFPDEAKLALLDMIYNLGPGRLFAEYPRLVSAVERGDWKTAAASSFRKGPAAARNYWAKQAFLNAAATVEIKAAAEGTAIGVVLLGLLSGLAAAAALAILSGEVDQLAARVRARRGE